MVYHTRAETRLIQCPWYKILNKPALHTLLHRALTNRLRGDTGRRMIVTFSFEDEAND